MSLIHLIKTEKNRSLMSVLEVVHNSLKGVLNFFKEIYFTIFSKVF